MKLKEFIETMRHEKDDWQYVAIFINGKLIKEFKSYELYGNDAFQDYKIKRQGITLLKGYCRYNVELEESEFNIIENDKLSEIKKVVYKPMNDKERVQALNEVRYILNRNPGEKTEVEVI